MKKEEMLQDNGEHVSNLLNALGESATNTKRIAQMRKNLEDIDLMEQSDSGSSDDPDNMLDEELS